MTDNRKMAHDRSPVRGSYRKRQVREGIERVWWELETAPFLLRDRIEDAINTMTRRTRWNRKIRC